MSLKLSKELTLLDWDGENFSYDGICVKRTIGDGSCYFHAIVDAFFIPYRSGKIHGKVLNRSSFIENLRRQLAIELSRPAPEYGGRTPYETLSRGELPSLSEDMVETRLQEMQRGLLSLKSVNYIYHEYISDALDKDIYILDGHKKDVYLIDSDMSLYFKGRKSVVIMYKHSHFETVGIISDGIFRSFFEPSNPFIRAIRKRSHDMIKVEKK